MKIISVILFAIVLTAACSQGYFVNTEVATQHPEGRELYISKCNSCHQLYNPDNYTNLGWDSILVTMQMKAKIKEEQSNQIYNWILEVKRDSVKTVFTK